MRKKLKLVDCKSSMILSPCSNSASVSLKDGPTVPRQITNTRMRSVFLRASVNVSVFMRDSPREKGQERRTKHSVGGMVHKAIISMKRGSTLNIEP